MADTTEDEQQVPHLRILELLPIAVNPGFSYWDTPFLIFFRWFSGPNFWWNFCGFWTAAWPWCTAFLSFKWDDVLRIRISSTCARRLWTPWKSCLFAGIGGRSTSPVWNHRQTIFPGDISICAERIRSGGIWWLIIWEWTHHEKSWSTFPHLQVASPENDSCTSQWMGLHEIHIPRNFFWMGHEWMPCQALINDLQAPLGWQLQRGDDLCPLIFLYRFNLRLPYELQHRYCTSSIQHV